MYAEQSIQDIIFLMLYGGVAMLALIASLYLCLRRNNGIASDIIPPKALRYWTSAFFMASALSHIWWFLFGNHWLTEDRLVRNIIAVTLDHITLVPLAMAMLLRMLQDRDRRIWPWFLAQVPTVAAACIGISTHNDNSLFLTHYWQGAVILVFIGYYIYALYHYSRWLRENFADLEHKEVWQSLLFVIIVCIIYQAYTTNPGDMVREYLSQINTIAIIAFLLWRVETLQILEIKKSEQEEEIKETGINTSLHTDIGKMLTNLGENTKFFLQHDLTLQQLASTLGTNRTYLSKYFSDHGTTYNAYINSLRIEHGIKTYQEAITAGRTILAQELASDCGFKSYSTFASVFKHLKGQSFTEWAKKQSQQ